MPVVSAVADLSIIVDLLFHILRVMAMATCH
jgi:hypothetical protein